MPHERDKRVRANNSLVRTRPTARFRDGHWDLAGRSARKRCSLRLHEAAASGSEVAHQIQVKGFQAKYWEIIADNLSASGLTWGVYLKLIRLVACFSQQTCTAVTEEDLLLVLTKSR